MFPPTIKIVGFHNAKSMKLLLISDIHFGVRSESPYFREQHGRLFDQIVGYLKEHFIDDIWVLGDVFDKRKNGDYATIKFAMEQFSRLEPYCHRIRMLVGNHDSYYKNTLLINSLKLIFRKECYDIHDSPHDDGEICIIPWICDDNYDACMETIRKSSSDICFGHFELAGFQYNKSTVASEGMDSSILSKFQTVLTGHYHIRSSRGNIHYLGSPIQLTWDDYNLFKGFHVFDTVTHKLEFIRNNDIVYMVYNYGDRIFPNRNMIVRVLVDGDVGKDDVDRYVEKVKVTEPYDLKVIFSPSKKDLSESESKIDCVDTRQSLTNFSSDYIEPDMSTEKMDSIIDGVYNEAVNMDGGS